ncbi:unnamed protein product [Amoebophrya sp. A120]|nr:unnamed protein product [Amoebophrya sp. A120]|eukprot:GSA120T00008820001.1
MRWRMEESNTLTGEPYTEGWVGSSAPDLERKWGLIPALKAEHLPGTTSSSEGIELPATTTTSSSSSTTVSITAQDLLRKKLLAKFEDEDKLHLFRFTTQGQKISKIAFATRSREGPAGAGTGNMGSDNFYTKPVVRQPDLLLHPMAMEYNLQREWEEEKLRYKQLSTPTIKTQLKFWEAINREIPLEAGLLRVALLHYEQTSEVTVSTVPMVPRMRDSSLDLDMGKLGFLQDKLIKNNKNRHPDGPAEVPIVGDMKKEQAAQAVSTTSVARTSSLETRMTSKSTYFHPTRDNPDDRFGDDADIYAKYGAHRYAMAEETTTKYRVEQQLMEVRKNFDQIGSIMKEEEKSRIIDLARNKIAPPATMMWGHVCGGAADAFHIQSTEISQKIFEQLNITWVSAGGSLIQKLRYGGRSFMHLVRDLVAFDGDDSSGSRTSSGQAATTGDVDVQQEDDPAKLLAPRPPAGAPEDAHQEDLTEKKRLRKLLEDEVLEYLAERRVRKLLHKGIQALEKKRKQEQKEALDGKFDVLLDEESDPALLFQKVMENWGTTSKNEGGVIAEDLLLSGPTTSSTSASRPASEILASAKQKAMKILPALEVESAPLKFSSALQGSFFPSSETADTVEDLYGIAAAVVPPSEEHDIASSGGAPPTAEQQKLRTTSAPASTSSSLEEQYNQQSEEEAAFIADNQMMNEGTGRGTETTRKHDHGTASTVSVSETTTPPPPPLRYSERLWALGRYWWSNETDPAFDEVILDSSASGSAVQEADNLLESDITAFHHLLRLLVESFNEKDNQNRLQANNTAGRATDETSTHVAPNTKPKPFTTFLDFLENPTNNLYPNFAKNIRNHEHYHKDWLLRFFLGSEALNRNFYQQKFRVHNDGQAEQREDEKVPAGEDVDVFVVFDSEKDYLQKLKKLESLFFTNGFACTFVDEIILPYYTKKNSHWLVGNPEKGAVPASLFTLMVYSPEPLLQVGRMLDVGANGLDVDGVTVKRVEEVLESYGFKNPKERAQAADVGDEEPPEEQDVDDHDEELNRFESAMKQQAYHGNDHEQEQGGFKLRGYGLNSDSDSEPQSESEFLASTGSTSTSNGNYGAEADAMPSSSSSSGAASSSAQKKKHNYLKMRFFRPEGRRWDSILEGVAGYDSFGCKRVPSNYAVQHKHVVETWEKNPNDTTTGHNTSFELFPWDPRHYWEQHAHPWTGDYGFLWTKDYFLHVHVLIKHVASSTASSDKGATNPGDDKTAGADDFQAEVDSGKKKDEDHQSPPSSTSSTTPSPLNSYPGSASQDENESTSSIIKNSTSNYNLLQDYAYVPNTQVCFEEEDLQTGPKNLIKMFKNPKHFRRTADVAETLEEYARKEWRTTTGARRGGGEVDEEEQQNMNKDERSPRDVLTPSGMKSTIFDRYGPRKTTGSTLNSRPQAFSTSGPPSPSTYPSSDLDTSSNSTYETRNPDHAPSATVHHQVDPQVKINRTNRVCFISTPDPEMEEEHFGGLHNRLLRTSYGLIPLKKMAGGGADREDTKTSTTKQCKYHHTTSNCPEDPEYMLHTLLHGVDSEKTCLGLPLKEKWDLFTEFDWELLKYSILKLEREGYQSMAPLIRNNEKCREMLRERGWSL